MAEDSVSAHVAQQQKKWEEYRARTASRSCTET